ncbi:MAG: ABC transporter permease subunit [Clostridiales bacterium]|jgi:putative aldouronate transport system permease protein|nr:ABC transporter permease subunit [Clostridiales bacterium]
MVKRPGFRLFLISAPFLALLFLFSYLPLTGWVYAFFDYRAGMKLSQTPFAGLKHFAMIWGNAATQRDIARVMVNTLAMSLLSLLASPLPMIFAVTLNEVRSSVFRKVAQTLTTLPYFISWVLVYSLAWAMFSIGDGFVNRILVATGASSSGINFLASKDHVWLTQWAYTTWKSLGWNAVIYFAAISGISGELYEAARVDGAGRWRIIWSITLPGLTSTFFVLLLLQVANFINNGMEQYYVFQNAMNKQHIEVLDLYVYNRGIVGNMIPFATAVSMLKSVVSVVLLFVANRLSKAVRGESIV